jgi:hypothetical protein
MPGQIGLHHPTEIPTERLLARAIDTVLLLGVLRTVGSLDPASLDRATTEPWSHTAPTMSRRPRVTRV